jgi:hypothetical protein
VAVQPVRGRLADDACGDHFVGWDAMPRRTRKLCLTLTDRAVATIDGIDTLAVLG